MRACIRNWMHLKNVEVKKHGATLSEYIPVKSKPMFETTVTLTPTTLPEGRGALSHLL